MKSVHFILLGGTSVFEYDQVWIDKEVANEEAGGDFEDAVISVANKRAADSWELVSVCPTMEIDGELPRSLTAYFKREKKTQS